MKWITAHFGDSAVAGAVIFALGVLSVGLLVSNGVVEVMFTKLLTDFFGNMMGLVS